MPDGTLLGALHGDLAHHPWYDSRAAFSDPYSLFYARSSASRWLTDAARNAPRDGLWYMNDAGLDSAGTGTRRLWFQVALNSAVSADRTLPTQPFLTCAGAVASRVGHLELSAVQMLLPLQELAGPPHHSRTAEIDLLQEAQWFADPVPDLAREVQLTLDSGQDPAIRSAAPSMVGWMGQLKQSVFTRICPPTRDEAAEELTPGIADHLWNGPAHHHATFRGSLVEWSYEALGWLSAFVAEAAVQHGIQTPVLLSIRRL
ncbi:hypothetical protein CDO52_07030 [Nocardiopsis gilva YIM 90087]|uniref:Uncharacterized protein n=1 Tax=Nocardiopsis gilva YIM 90087 TaxID=1235441 RepID=A0A223S3I0_9ACTN|nr:hypothetical protein [Nocardiopsis gilva]ASU82569.1 hypothetical protein CDO52_07030 [Nocardiopsis gilva YIM 90087]